MAFAMISARLLLLLAAAAARDVPPRSRLDSYSPEELVHMHERATPTSRLERLVSKGRWNCVRNHSLEWSTVPTLTNAALRETLRGRWVFILGDSDLRMWHNYLVARLADTWGRTWPRHVDNHGPPGGEVGLSPEKCKKTSVLGRTRCRPRRPMMVDCRGDDVGCTYDGWVGGARVTFVWQQVAARNALGTVGRLLANATKSPDVVVVTLGAWEVTSTVGATHAEFFDGLVEILGRGSTHWPAYLLGNLWKARPARETPRIVFASLPHCMPKKLDGQFYDRETLRYDNESLALVRSRYPTFEVFDRGAMTELRPDVAKACRGRYDASCELGTYHPTGDLLAGMIDVFAASSFPPRRAPGP